MHRTWIFKLCNKKNVNILPWRNMWQHFRLITAVQCSVVVVLPQHTLKQELIPEQFKCSGGPEEWLKVTAPSKIVAQCICELLRGRVYSFPYFYERREVELTVAQSLRISWIPDFVAVYIHVLVLCTHWTNSYIQKRRMCKNIMATLRDYVPDVLSFSICISLALFQAQFLVLAITKRCLICKLSRFCR